MQTQLGFKKTYIYQKNMVHGTTGTLVEGYELRSTFVLEGVSRL